VREVDIDALAAEIEARHLHLRLPEPIHESAQKLLATLGVTWEIDPTAPRLAEPQTSETEGHKQWRKKRRSMSERP
jgi:hypothetical protein